MKNEIEQIIVNHIDRKISLGEATTQILRLFAVSGRSEQLVCDKCVEDLSKSKSFKKGICVHCRKEIEQTNCH